MRPISHPQAARTVPEQRLPTTRRRDVLDVTLHDDELQAETELTAHLMASVNEVPGAEGDGPLPQKEIDRLLGLSS